MNFQTVSVAQKIPMTPTTLIGPDANGNYTTSAPQPAATSGSTANWCPARSFPAPSTTSTLNSAGWSREIHKNGLGELDNHHRHGKARPVTDRPERARHREGRSDHQRDQRSLGEEPPEQASLSWPVPMTTCGSPTSRTTLRLLVTSSRATCGITPLRVSTSTTTPSPLSIRAWPKISAGAAAANFFGVPVNDGRYPDVFGEVQEGVVYSGPTKLAEHGGMNPGDRHVLMVVNGPGIPRQVESTSVETTQVAPTILSLLGLDPADLSAVRIEGTQILPGLRGCAADIRQRGRDAC